MFLSTHPCPNLRQWCNSTTLEQNVQSVGKGLPHQMSDMYLNIKIISGDMIDIITMQPLTMSTTCISVF